MAEEQRITIEHPEVRETIRRLIADEGQIAPWRHPELTEGELWNWAVIIWREAYSKLVEIGYLQAVESPGYPWDTIYRQMVRDYKTGSLSKIDFGNWCTAEGQGQIVNSVALSHQRQFGEPEIGYQPDERLARGREAFARYLEAHAQLYLRGRYPEIHDDHTPLLEKLEQEVIAAGFESLEEFHETRLY